VTEHTILVVEDDPEIRDAIADTLEMAGYRVATAENGALALAAIERGLPRLVLLDMRMPVLDGWGFARALAERNVKLPILVVTAARDARQWAAEIGADGFIAKPFGVKDLIAAVKGLCPDVPTSRGASG
jgi:two-component system, chemotaxis family, chemotaxis protein CheY